VEGIEPSPPKDTLDKLEELRKEAGVSYPEAIQNPKRKAPAK